MKKTCLFRRAVLTALAVLMAFSLWTPVCAAPPSISSDYYILMDAATGQVLYEKNSTAQLPPAGLVKILTALVAVENISDPTAKLSVTSSALTPLGTGVKSIGLTAGELVPAVDCLYAMLMTSANDAANVVAESVGTSLDGFMTMLRNRAAELGADTTVLVNPSAEGQVSSARDIALFTRAALANASFMQYFGKVSYALQPTNKRTEAKNMKTSFLMLRESDYHYEGIIGGMTGYTSASQFVIMATAERDGRQLIAVVMKAESEANLYADTAKLLDHGFSDFVPVQMPDGDLNVTASIVTDGLITGKMHFRLENAPSVLLRSDYDVSHLSISPNAVPEVIEAGTEQPYTADIVYTPNPDDPSQKIVLLSGITLQTTIETVEPTQTSEPAQTNPVVTDKNGAVVTDESGNPVTQTLATSSGKSAGKSIGRFFKSFFIVLLILIAAVVGLLLLFIAALFILREVKRAKRRKAREQARMQQRYRQDPSDRQ